MTIHADYPCHVGNYKKGRTQPIRYLVIHYVGATGGAKNNAKYYGSTSGIGASAHYFVGHASENAAVYASVPESDTAWHCGRSDGHYSHPYCRNANSIGIEMCCHQTSSGVWYFDPETVTQTVELAREIMARHHIPLENVVRHYDVTGKVCPAPYVHDQRAWSAFKARLTEPVSSAATQTEEGPDMFTQEQFNAMYNAVNPIYNTLDDVPAYWRDDVKALIDAGYIRGDGTHPVALRAETIKSLVIMRRMLQS